MKRVLLVLVVSFVATLPVFAAENKTFRASWNDPVPENAASQTVQWFINDVAVGGPSNTPLNQTSVQRVILVNNDDVIRATVAFFNSAGNAVGSGTVAATVAVVNPPGQPIVTVEQLD